MHDFERLVKLSQVFPQIDMAGGTVVEPNDLPLDSRHLEMVFALMTLSDKPFMGSVTSGPNARDTLAMADILFGGRAQIEERPVVMSIINVNSPLRFDDRMLAAMLEYSRANQPVIVTPFLLMGAMSPVSSPAALVQQTAEALAGVALISSSARAARSCSARSCRTSTCSQAHRCSAPQSRHSACWPAARWPAGWACPGAAAAAA